MYICEKASRDTSQSYRVAEEAFESYSQGRLKYLPSNYIVSYCRFRMTDDYKTKGRDKWDGEFSRSDEALHLTVRWIPEDDAYKLIFNILQFK